MTFKEKFLSSRKKSHLQQAVRMWIDINKALSGNINPLYTLFHLSPVFMASVILFLLVKVFFQTTNFCQTHFGKCYVTCCFLEIFQFSYLVCLIFFLNPNNFHLLLITKDSYYPVVHLFKFLLPIFLSCISF